MTSHRLAFLIPGDLRSCTGGYVYDRRLIAELRALDWRVDVYTLDGSFPRPSAAALAHADRVLAALPADSLVLLDGLAVSAMPQVLRTHAPRLRLAALMHMPLAADVGIEREQRQRVRWTEAQALQWVRHVIATGPGTLEHLRAAGLEAARLSLIRPGTDVASPGSNASRPPGYPLRLLCVATLQPGKGHELLFNALFELAELPWQLTCVGSLTRSPETAARLCAQLERLGLSARVLLPGELEAEAVAAQYQRADLFVLATLFESYGMAVAEALAHGLPVLSTRTGAITQLVDERAGYVVPCGDRTALTTALAALLREPAQLTRLARGAAAAGARLPRWADAGREFSHLLASVH